MGDEVNLAFERLKMRDQITDEAWIIHLQAKFVLPGIAAAHQQARDVEPHFHWAACALYRRLKRQAQCHIGGEQDLAGDTHVAGRLQRERITGGDNLA